MAAKVHIEKKINYTHLYTSQITIKLEKSILSSYAKFHNNSPKNDWVMGLWNFTKLLPFANSSQLTMDIFESSKILIQTK